MRKRILSMFLALFLMFILMVVPAAGSTDHNLPSPISIPQLPPLPSPEKFFVPTVEILKLKDAAKGFLNSAVNGWKAFDSLAEKAGGQVKYKAKSNSVRDTQDLSNWKFLASYHNFLGRLMLFTAFVILLSSLDDLFIDLCYWTRRFYRRLFVTNRYPSVRAEDLRTLPEKPIAVMVPAWQESDVIASMIESNIQFIDYHNYMIFVGAYQNDPGTIREIDRMVLKYPSVKKVVVPHDGPTCKADCLNWIIQAIFLHEKNNGTQFEMVAMHDSEDIFHPLEFRMFNHLVPRKDLIQIPVRGLEGRWCDFVRGTYVDEFAEYHNKDMVVREALTGVVPSAGVASCFSRKAIIALRDSNAEHVFNSDTLTEDYDISFRLAASHGELKQVFVTFPVTISMRKKWGTGPFSMQRNKRIPIAVSEYFPNRFWQAVRQKTRWNIGIFFQAVGKTTWAGGLWKKYFFLHDRKGIVTNLIVIPAYFLLANIVAFAVAETFFGLPYHIFDLPPWLVYVSTGLMLNRCFQRFYFTMYFYNWREGLLSIPRIIFSNAVNFCSTVRATWIYMKYLSTGVRITWDKTQHEYPSLTVLERSYKRLGEVLVEMKKIGEADLKAALDEQKICRTALGSVLIGKGAIAEDELLDILCSQMNFARGNMAEADPKRAQELLPTSFILEREVYPISVTEGNILRVFVTKALSPEIRKALVSGDYSSVEPFLITDIAMERLKEQLHTRGEGHKKLGNLLLEKELLTEKQLQAALQRQRQENRFLGDVLVEDGYLSKTDLLELLSEQAGCPAACVESDTRISLGLLLLHASIIMVYEIFPFGIKISTRGEPILQAYCTKALTKKVREVVREQGYVDVEPYVILESEMKRILAQVKATVAGTFKDEQNEPLKNFPQPSKEAVV
jgi:adsorption protein B